MDHIHNILSRRSTWVDGPVIVGAGPSGLAVAACLRQRGVPFVVLDKADCIASLWQNRTYDRLKLHLPKQFCQLPEFAFPADFPEYPTKSQFVSYLESYAAEFQIRPQFNECVRSAKHDDSLGVWRVVTGKAGGSEEMEYVCRGLVVATGENAEAVVPEIDGLREFAGKVIHACDHNAEPSIVCRSSIDWSHPDLAEALAEYIDGDMDALHFRSVCSGWRACLPAREGLSPMKLPAVYGNDDEVDTFMVPSAVYLIDEDGLIRVRRMDSSVTEFELLSPTKPARLIRTSPTSINLSQFRILQIGKLAEIEQVERGDDDRWPAWFRKVVVASPPLMVAALRSDTSIACWRDGDETWSDFATSPVVDIIAIGGIVYSVDDGGVMRSFDSTLQVTTIPSDYTCSGFLAAKKKRLVYFQSTLYLVAYEERSESAGIELKVFSQSSDEIGNWKEADNPQAMFVLGSGGISYAIPLFGQHTASVSFYCSGLDALARKLWVFDLATSIASPIVLNQSMFRLLHPVL